MQSHSQYTWIAFCLAAGLLLAVVLVSLPGIGLTAGSHPAHAAAGQFFVSPTGSGSACSAVLPCSLATAISQAIDGDEIFVAQGTYTASASAVVSLTHSVALLGGWDSLSSEPPSRNPQAYPSILDGEGQRPVVYIQGDITPTLSGFLLTGGYNSDGGGLHIDGAHALIHANIITASQTYTGIYNGGRGGGIFISGSSRTVIVGNLISNNTSGYGGGIFHDANTPVTIIGNLITGNQAGYRAGGIMVERAPDHVQANRIVNNFAQVDGGGLVVWAAAPRLEGNYIAENLAGSGAAISLGNNATPQIYNNLLISNTLDALAIYSSSPQVVNNTIIGSGKSGSGEGIYLYSSPTCTSPYCTTGDYRNNIVSNYQTGIAGTGLLTLTLDYNDVWGNLVHDFNLLPAVVTGTHNISQDPLFIDATAGDYHLSFDSPCVDAGDPAGVPPAPLADIDNKPRPLGLAVDIGADEYGLYLYLPLAIQSEP